MMHLRPYAREMVLKVNYSSCYGNITADLGKILVELSCYVSIEFL